MLKSETSIEKSNDSRGEKIKDVKYIEKKLSKINLNISDLKKYQLCMELINSAIRKYSDSEINVHKL